jgi:hypothetical protein
MFRVVIMIIKSLIKSCKIWGFHGGDYEEWCLLIKSLEKSILLDKECLLKVDWHFWGIFHLYVEGRSVSQAWNQGDVGSKLSFSSEGERDIFLQKSDNFQQTT